MYISNSPSALIATESQCLSGLLTEDHDSTGSLIIFGQNIGDLLKEADWPGLAESRVSSYRPEGNGEIVQIFIYRDNAGGNRRERVSAEHSYLPDC
jgi:hypothetical protein